MPSTPAHRSFALALLTSSATHDHPGRLGCAARRRGQPSQRTQRRWRSGDAASIRTTHRNRKPKCTPAASRAGGGANSAGGTDLPYRSRVTDPYDCGRKTRTALRFPDQTIELTWRPGKPIGLQFDDMAPKEATYARSEGETHWVFEGNTLDDFPDKDKARCELQRLRN